MIAHLVHWWWIAQILQAYRVVQRMAAIFNGKFTKYFVKYFKINCLKRRESANKSHGIKFKIIVCTYVIKSRSSKNSWGIPSREIRWLWHSLGILQEYPFSLLLLWHHSDRRSWWIQRRKNYDQYLFFISIISNTMDKIGYPVELSRLHDIT